MTRVDVGTDLLRWAVERSGLSKKGLELRFPDLLHWQEKRKKPTLRQLEQFAASTRTPFGYFFLSEPPEEGLPIPHFRTAPRKRTQRPSPDLIDTIYLMQQRQEWMREFLIRDGEERLPYPGKAKLRDNPAAVARDIRETLGLTDGWASRHSRWEAALRALQDAIENAGILLASNGIVGNNTHRKLSVDEFRGFVLTDEYAPLVFVNAADYKSAQMFTIAHEVAHVWFGRSAAFDLRKLEAADDETEQVCNRVAAEVLVPEGEFRPFWGSIGRESDRFQLGARHFKVSPLVIARRAADLSLIPKSEYFKFYEETQQQENDKPKSSGGNFYATQALRVGRRFGIAVVRAAKKGQLSYHEAYKLTGLSGGTFNEFAARLFGPLPS